MRSRRALVAWGLVLVACAGSEQQREPPRAQASPVSDTHDGPDACGARATALETRRANATARQLKQLLQGCPELSTQQIWQISQLQQELDPNDYLRLIQLLRERKDAHPDQDYRLARRLAEASVSLEQRMRKAEKMSKDISELQARCASLANGQTPLSESGAADCLSTIQRSNTCSLAREANAHQLVSAALERIATSPQRLTRARAHYELASQHYCRGQLGKAEQSWDTVVQLTTTEPIRAAALQLLVELLRQRDKRAALEAIADRMVSDSHFNDLSESLRTELAISKATNIYDRTDGNFAACARELDEFLEVFPDSGVATTNALFNAGNCHFRRGNRAAAIERWRKLQRRDPSSPLLETVRELGVEL